LAVDEATATEQAFGQKYSQAHSQGDLSSRGRCVAAVTGW